MSTWPEAAREVTPEESDAIRRLDAEILTALHDSDGHAVGPTPAHVERYKSEHFRKTYGLWLETGD